MRRLREAREFSSCGEFLGAVRPREGKCLILDVHIPGMSGLELLENFAPQPRRARPAHRRVAAPVTPRYARFAVARAGQRGDPGFDTAWKLANVGRIPCPPREGCEPGVLDMNEMQVPQPEQVAAAPLPSRRGDPLRRWTLAILVVCVLLFGWTLIADRLTPYTSDASVRTFVVRIRPEVSGKIIEVAVHDNQIVRTGDLLYRIDPIPFRIAVERAEAKLAAAGQAVGASTAAVDEAQAQLVREIAQRDNVREQAARVFELVRVGVYAASKGDQARSELDTAEAQVQRARAALEQARQALGPQGADNPQIREALAALEQARLDLTRTTLLAPDDGVVSNLQLNIGQFAAAGQPALTFLDARLVWLQAFVRENSLEYIRPGVQAEVVLDVLPGRVLPARVESLGWGVGEGDVDSTTGLPKTRQGTGGWLAPAQRFPVQLAFETAGGPPRGVRYNARASVILYTGDHPVFNALAWVWIRVIAVLTYVS